MTTVLPPQAVQIPDWDDLTREVRTYAVADVAGFLGCSADHVRDLVRDRELAGTNIGLRGVRIRHTELVKFLDRRTGVTP